MKKFLSLLVLVGGVITASAVDYEQAVADLIPRLGDPAAGNRYSAQMALQVLTSTASKPGAETERLACGKVLAAKAADSSVPQPARVWIVRQLQYMGGAEAVDTLTTLLNGSDAELRESARQALEKNPAPAATTSLRAALAKSADAPWTIGLMNSLGERRDTAAVSLIVKQLSDAKTAASAARALGRIASPDAVAALWKSFPSVPQVGDALIGVANRLVASGDKAAASTIFVKLNEPSQPSPLRVAALKGLAQADPAAARKPIAEALAGSDARLQAAAVAASTTSPELAKQLTALLPKLSVPVQVKALAVVDASALSAVIALATGPDSAVRLAAVGALTRLGSAEAAMVLLKIVTTGESADKTAAESALASITGNEALTALEKAAGSDDVKMRVASLNALTARQQKSALPLMVAAANNSDSALRKAGLTGLRQMGGEAQIEALAKVVVVTKNAEAKLVLTALAGRATDKPAAAAKLLGLAGTDEAALAALAPALAVFGGDQVLAALSRLTASKNADAQQSAIEALRDWPDLGAAPPLQALAGSAQAGADIHSAALAALVNLVKNVETASSDSRVTAALAALKAARDPAETKLALSALAAAPDAKSATAAQGLLADPAVKQEAASTVLDIAEVLDKTDKAAAKRLAEGVVAANVSPDLKTRANKLLGN